MQLLWKTNKSHQTIKASTDGWVSLYLSIFDRWLCLVVVSCPNWDTNYKQKHTLNLIPNILSSLITIDNDTVFSLSEYIFFFAVCYHNFVSPIAAIFCFFFSYPGCLATFVSYVFVLFTLVWACLSMGFYFFSQTQCSIVVIMCKLQFSVCD